MDFIDPIKRRRHKIRLIVGYFILGTAILLTALILLYQANGYGFGKNGQIIQNGLVFVSSTPSPATIELNGVASGSTTNTRLELPAGQYTLKLTRPGYRSWVRAIGVDGDSVESFTYPFLFPTSLVTTTVSSYSALPPLTLQSPSRQWLLLEQPGTIGSFDEFDLTKPKTLTATLTNVSIPTTLLNQNAQGQSLQLISWANDNRHVLLLYTYQGGSEYILLDRQVPSDSIDLSKTLSLTASDQLSLQNGKYDQYYLYDTTALSLATASISSPAPTPLLSQVLSYTSYGNNVLYVTDASAPTGKVSVEILQGTTSYPITNLLVSPTYLLDMTQFAGDTYIIVAASNDAKQYVYEDPVSELQSTPDSPPVPIYILKVTQPSFVSFSANSQFAMSENGDTIATYDEQNNKNYAYVLTQPIPAGYHASWMDGDHLMVVAGGKVVVFDYDDANLQTLQPAVDGTTPAFDPSYQWMYTLAPLSSPSSTSTYGLTSTALLIPADQ
jgi:hypothetical protein